MTSRKSRANGGDVADLEVELVRVSDERDRLLERLEKSTARLVSTTETLEQLTAAVGELQASLGGLSELTGEKVSSGRQQSAELPLCDWCERRHGVDLCDRHKTAKLRGILYDVWFHARAMASPAEYPDYPEAATELMAMRHEMARVLDETGDGLPAVRECPALAHAGRLPGVDRVAEAIFLCRQVEAGVSGDMALRWGCWATDGNSPGVLQEWERDDYRTEALAAIAAYRGAPASVAADVYGSRCGAGTERACFGRLSSWGGADGPGEAGNDFGRCERGSARPAGDASAGAKGDL
jgi:hypothetical protein